MDYIETLERSEEFAKKIINLAAEDNMTVYELCKAADIAKAVSENSMVDKESIEKTDFASCYITETCDEEELFSIGEVREDVKSNA